MFISNKYLKHYFNLIEKRKICLPPDSEICEQHHIIPKCLGGSNKKENIICLTAREHYIAHKFLIKMTSGNSQEKMIYSFWRMTTRIKYNDKHTYKSSKNYELARKLFLDIAGSSTRGKTYEEIYGEEKSQELKQLRADNITKNRKNKTWEQIFGIEKAKWMRERVSLGASKRKNKPLSEERKLKISNSSKGKVYSKVCCPICQREIGSNNIKRHIENH